jgi:formylglycine-generating enzyme required for sulfatase activity
VFVALLLPACGGGGGAADVLADVDAAQSDDGLYDPGPATDRLDVADKPDASPPDPGITADIPCLPDCTNRRCGDDGCGGSCGTCPYPDAHLECVDGKCLPPMVDIPAGTFWMGCNEAVDGECEGDEKPRHEVTLSAYRIDTYEVTAGAYKEYLAAVGPGCTNPGDGKACWSASSAADDRLNVNDPGREAYPANGVEWNQAAGYCQWAGRSLCTEAQWEYAARGSDGRKFPWGNDCPASWGDQCSAPEWTEATAKANCLEEYCQDGYPPSDHFDYDYSSTPVGSFPAGASPFGVMDLAGNVTEWTRDVYGSDFYCMGPDTDTYKDFPACPEGAAPYQAPWVDPVSQAKGVFRVLRGGAYVAFPGSVEGSLRCSDRKRLSFKFTDIITGFRCCSSSAP